MLAYTARQKQIFLFILIPLSINPHCHVNGEKNVYKHRIFMQSISPRHKEKIIFFRMHEMTRKLFVITD